MHHSLLDNIVDNINSFIEDNDVLSTVYNLILNLSAFGARRFSTEKFVEKILT